MDTGQLRTAALRSAHPELTVPGVAEAGDDVALLVKALIERGDMDRHDLLVPLDLSIYDDEEPATAIVHFFAHTTMTADVVREGIPSVAPFGLARVSDIERFAVWANENEVRGAPSRALGLSRAARRPHPVPLGDKRLAQ